MVAMEVFAIEYDSTLFSKLAADFNSWVLDLLSKLLIEDVPDQLLAKTQAVFACSAYWCCYSHCIILSNSLVTPRLHKEHEATHFPRFHCEITSCPWNRMGFKDQSDLKKHDHITIRTIDLWHRPKYDCCQEKYQRTRSANKIGSGSKTTGPQRSVTIGKSLDNISQRIT